MGYLLLYLIFGFCFMKYYEINYIKRNAITFFLLPLSKNERWGHFIGSVILIVFWFIFAIGMPLQSDEDNEEIYLNEDDMERLHDEIENIVNDKDYARDKI